MIGIPNSKPFDDTLPLSYIHEQLRALACGWAEQAVDPVAVAKGLLDALLTHITDERSYHLAREFAIAPYLLLRQADPKAWNEYAEAFLAKRTELGIDPRPAQREAA